MTTPGSLHEFTAPTPTGEDRPLSEYAGQVAVVVNTASRCGLTPQFTGLQELYEQYRDQGLVVLGFPSDQFGHQEPGNAEEIHNFCSLTYDVSFPMFAKVDVNGDAAHPLWRHLKEAAPGVLGTEAIKWNFTKFLVGKDGRVIKRYGSTTKPEKLAGDIEKALAA